MRIQSPVLFVNQRVHLLLQSVSGKYGILDRQNKGEKIMYEYLRGIITKITAKYIVLEANGIGYILHVANPYAYSGQVNQETQIYVHQVVREDAHLLYGFRSEDEKKLLEAQRLRQRTEYDLEMINEIGYCKGIENYSRYLSGYNSEIFKVPMRQGYEEAKVKMEDEIYNTISSDVLRRYDRVRDIRYSIYWSDEYYRLLLLPVYSMSYSFNGKSYQIVINGENGKIVGEYPKSAVKIAIAVILAVIALGLLFYYMNK